MEHRGADFSVRIRIPPAAESHILSFHRHSKDAGSYQVFNPQPLQIRRSICLSLRTVKRGQAIDSGKSAP